MGVYIFKCPNCGGELVFDPASQKYKCGYCLSDFSQEEMDAISGRQESASREEGSGTGPGSQAAPEAEESSAYAGEDTSGGESGAVMYNCPSCGAEVITDSTTAATFCYYCHNPVILEGAVSGEYLPDSLIPFRIGKEQAKDAFLSYVRKKRFVPRSFFSEEQIEKLSGIYFPYWVYESTIQGEVEGTATKVRVYRVGDSEVTETNIYHIGRGGDASFDQMTRNALRKSDRLLIDNVQPYEMEELRPFQMSYLSGFLAEKRDIDKDRFAVELQAECRKYAENVFRSSVNGYTTVNLSSQNYSVVNEHWQYVLLPVWILTYRRPGGEKIWYYAMNGQNGRIFGELPIDGKKIALMCSLLFIVVTALAMIGGYLI